MADKSTKTVIQQVQDEQFQGHQTRSRLFVELERLLGKPIVTFFTSFNFPVGIENDDADMMEGIFQKMDLSKGLVLIISSPGGDGIAAERIINVCRSYSGTSKYSTIVPGKAKSAATMVCFGSEEITMSETSELGPVDPQLMTMENDKLKVFSIYDIVKGYEDLFKRAVKEKGNLQPYLQQLANYDEREIMEMKKSLALAEDIAIRSLCNGMMQGNEKKDIKSKIGMFLTPEHTKSHGRPICREETAQCGLKVKAVSVKDPLWSLVFELYTRTSNFVSTKASKCIESKEYSFYAGRK